MGNTIVCAFLTQKLYLIDVHQISLMSFQIIFVPYVIKLNKAEVWIKNDINTIKNTSANNVNTFPAYFKCLNK